MNNFFKTCQDPIFWALILTTITLILLLLFPVKDEEIEYTQQAAGPIIIQGPTGSPTTCTQIGGKSNSTLICS